MVTTAPDTELLQRIRLRDAGALKALHERYGRFAFAIAYRSLGDSGAAEEAVQDAFLSVWNRAETFALTDDANVRGWLLTIVRNRAIDELRRRQRRPVATMEMEALDVLATAPDAWADVEANDLRDRVQAALGALPEAQQQVITLAYFEGLSQSEIAERLDAPLGTIKGRFRMGFQKLAQSLREESPGGSPLRTDE